MEWHLENLIEELDSDREWFLDTGARPRQLYYMPANRSAPPATVFGIHLKTLLSIKGTQSKLAHNIRLDSLKFEGSAPTFLDEYEAPSGG
eukprot:SAG22_NODE_19775_length_271_cov_1.209302_1_plen_89_part_11